MVDAAEIWTIGHSNHTIDRFLALTTEASIGVIVDIRSQPFSRYSSHFNRAPLASALQTADIEYRFMGDKLGGRPRDSSLYDEDDHVDYRGLSETPLFRSGIVDLLELAGNIRLAIMCSEEDPTHCHRNLLVARVLLDEGIAIEHLRGDGRRQYPEELGPRKDPTTQQSFFADPPSQEAPWRSTRPVSRSTPPESSSNH